MILGFLIFVMLISTIAAAISLVLGSSVLQAVAIYSCVGTLSILVCATFQYAWPIMLNLIKAPRMRSERSGLSKSDPPSH